MERGSVIDAQIEQQESILASLWCGARRFEANEMLAYLQGRDDANRLRIMSLEPQKSKKNEKQLVL